MRKQLSEAEAWREIAARISRVPKGQYAYLCWYVNPDFDSPCLLENVGPATRTRMARRILDHLDTMCASDCEAPRSHMGSGQKDRLSSRILAALFLALEAKDEALSASSQVVGGEKR